MRGGHEGCISLLSQVLATFCTQTLHYYWMAAFFDSDDDTPGEKQKKTIIVGVGGVVKPYLHVANKPNLNFHQISS